VCCPTRSLKKADIREAPLAGSGKAIAKELLEAWVRLNTGPGLAYAKSLLRDHHQAEDIVQDCLCRILSRAGEYDLISDGRRILFRSITNACINHSTRFRLVTGLEDEENGSEYQVMDHREQQPVDQLVYRETSQKIAAILDLLPTEQRAALQMKSVGCSQEEIASELGILPNHAGVLIFRARKFVEKHLGGLMEEQTV
jgi:RNA polymerase sigma-70 factor, ECF subfamily